MLLHTPHPWSHDVLHLFFLMFLSTSPSGKPLAPALLSILMVLSHAPLDRIMTSAPPQGHHPLRPRAASKGTEGRSQGYPQRLNHECNWGVWSAAVQVVGYLVGRPICFVAHKLKPLLMAQHVGCEGFHVFLQVWRGYLYPLVY